MKEFKFEIDLTLTATVTVEAENEEEARLIAYHEVGDMTVGELEELSSETNLISETERCDYCCEHFDVDFEHLVDYDGMRICPDCKEELEEGRK